MAHAEHILSNLQPDAMLSLAQELIKIPSFKTEETPVARYLGEFFTARGYDVQLQEVQPEPFGADNILTVHAGVVEMAIHTLGSSRHISRMEEAVDAIEKMCKAIPVLKSVQFTHTPRADLPGLPRLNVGCIIGGRGRDYDLRGPNFTCDVCTVLVDVRFLPGMTSESVVPSDGRSRPTALSPRGRAASPSGRSVCSRARPVSSP